MRHLLLVLLWTSLIWYTAAFVGSHTCTNTAGCEILLRPPCSHPSSLLVQANATLQEFANLRKHSEDWIESSTYIINSAQILSKTLPMLQVWNCRHTFCISDYTSWFATIWKFGNKLCSGLSAAESWCCVSSLLLSLSALRIPSAIPLWRTSLRCRQTSMSAKWRRHSATSVSEHSKVYFCKLQIPGLAHHSFCTSYL